MHRHTHTLVLCYGGWLEQDRSYSFFDFILPVVSSGGPQGKIKKKTLKRRRAPSVYPSLITARARYHKVFVRFSYRRRKSLLGQQRVVLVVVFLWVLEWPAGDCVCVYPLHLLYSRICLDGEPRCSFSALMTQ